MTGTSLPFFITEEAVAQRGEVKCVRLNSLVEERLVWIRGLESQSGIIAPTPR